MPNDGVQIIDATNQTKRRLEAEAQSARAPEVVAIEPEDASDESVHEPELDAKVEGEHIVLKPHIETPPTPEHALDLAHPAPPPEIEKPAPPQEEFVEPPFELKTFIRTALSGILLFFRELKPSKIERILLAAEEQGSITVEDVASQFHISGAMATRYLAQLVARGKLRKMGVHQSRYEPTSELSF